MRLLRLADVPTSDRDRVFRASPWNASIFFGASAAAALAIIAFGWHERAWPFYYIGGVFLAMLLLVKRTLTARFRPSNWLVRVGDGGVYLQFRSYLNHHFPADDLTVVQIGLSEMRVARRVNERRDVVSGNAKYENNVTEQRRTLVEIAVESDTAELAEALKKERAKHGPRQAMWFGSSSTRYGHYPVRVSSPGHIEIEWAASPKPEAFFEALQPHVRIGDEVQITRDFTGAADASGKDQESKLLELAESGDTMAAIALARKIYGYDLTQAKTFVDGLLGRTDRKLRQDPAQRPIH
jgi:hypothetical protein